MSESITNCGICGNDMLKVEWNWQEEDAHILCVLKKAETVCGKCGVQFSIYDDETDCENCGGKMIPLKFERLGKIVKGLYIKGYDKS